MFDSQEQLIKFISGSGYTPEELQQIIAHYQRNGVTGYKMLMELEAFAVARSISPNLIADKLKEYCM